MVIGREIDCDALRRYERRLYPLAFFSISSFVRGSVDGSFTVSTWRVRRGVFCVLEGRESRGFSHVLV